MEVERYSSLCYGCCNVGVVEEEVSERNGGGRGGKWCAGGGFRCFERNVRLALWVLLCERICGERFRSGAT